VSKLLDPIPLPEGLDIPAEEWQRTLLSVRLFVLTLLKRVEALETRLRQDSSNITLLWSQCIDGINQVAIAGERLQCGCLVGL
jgi:hypothetical protein